MLLVGAARLGSARARVRVRARARARARDRVGVGARARARARVTVRVRLRLRVRVRVSRLLGSARELSHAGELAVAPTQPAHSLGAFPVHQLPGQG